jgi:hypothetical protein
MIRKALLSALTRIVGRVRTRDEFAATVNLSPRRREQPTTEWSIERIRGARNDQLRGQFYQPVRLAEAMRTDDAVFTAKITRTDALKSVATELRAANGTRGTAVQHKALEAVHVSRAVISSAHESLVEHGIAILYNEAEADEDGTCIQFRVKEWPLEHVKWNSFRERLETSVKDGGAFIPITHGDGFWIVIQKSDVLPWTKDACILPGAMIFGAHTLGIADWSSVSKSHALAKVIGKLPSGVSIQADATGGLTPQALGYLNMLVEVMTGDAGVGVVPYGTETQFLANASSAHQVFSELADNREKAAQRVYTGTDASLGSQGGAPGVDISLLFGVATTRLQGDFEAIEQALNTGCYAPWTARNYGDSRLSPKFKFLLPQPDEDELGEQREKAHDRLIKAVKSRKEQGFTVDQPVVDQIAKDFGIDPAPQLAAAGESTVTVVLAPTDIAKVVRGVEARNSQGLPPFGDARDNMTITEIEQASMAKQAPPPALEQPTNESGSAPQPQDVA